MKLGTQIIPVLDLRPEVAELWDELNVAIQEVLRSTEFIMGEEVRLFEQEVAQYLGVGHTVGLNSGTDALVIALRALEIGPGDEVITTPFTFFATAEAISLVGAKPVFVDIDPASFNINPELIESAITPRTKAILPVHLYGRPSEMESILTLAQRHGLKVIEDCAQSFGAKYGGCYTGTLGDLGAYSFFPSKNLGAYGDGGLLVTHDGALAEKARMLRAHGAHKKYHNEIIGYNSRLDTLQAAILRVKLRYLERYNQKRRQVAATYNQLLAGLEGVITPEISEGHVFHQYTLRIQGKRDAVQAKLTEAGIGTMVYYPVPVHRLPVYDLPSGSFPQTEQAASEVLSLPIWPQIKPEVQQQVTRVLMRALMQT